MPDGPHRIDWEWEEIVLACDLVAQNSWRQLDASDPRVRELSGMLQRMSMHPPEDRLPSFRNAAGVARKTYNIATVHPDYAGPPSNGNKLDKKVLDEFLDDREQMHRYAQSLRQAAERDELGNVSHLVGDEYESVLEGRYLLRLHRVRERKPALREKKIRSVQARAMRSRAKRAALTSSRLTAIGARASLKASTGRDDRTAVCLRLSSDHARVLIEVWDGDPRPPAPKDLSEDGTPDPHEEGGRGLFLVTALSTRWDWYLTQEPAGKVVWCELAAEPPEPSEGARSARQALLPQRVPREQQKQPIEVMNDLDLLRRIRDRLRDLSLAGDAQRRCRRAASASPSSVW
jgi:hypothetical protein